MTFEEFFLKKKINILSFQQKELVLFQELYSEYQTQGAKSFDYSKKFLFNTLRIKYPHQEVEQAKETNTVVSNTEEFIQQQETQNAVAPSGFKPRFRM